MRASRSIAVVFALGVVGCASSSQAPPPVAAPDAAALGTPPTPTPPDAAPPDAASVSSPVPPLISVDAAPAGPATSVEQISVPGTGAAVTMKTTLVQGAIYLLKASGAADVGGKKLDAEFQGEGTDEAGGSDFGIDTGVLQPHAMNHTTKVPPGPGRLKWYGGARADHTYYTTVTGEGKALALKLIGGAGGATGAIDVALYELSGAPAAVYTIAPSATPPPAADPKIGRPAVDTVQVPMMKTVAPGQFATVAGAVYLLQASGVGQVSRGEVTPARNHMGDAQYMDWPADGTKYNDGECGAEFGIGVDELAGPDPCTGGIVYKHRLNWWGPYRNDHVYYMLYAGTGKPISFLYYDSGYGDNSPVHTLTVRIFAAP